MENLNEKKQIEEMAKVIKSSLDGLGCGKFNFTGEEISTMFAKALFNADYRKQEWISVEDRLPDKSGDYLALTTNGNHAVLVYSAEYRLFNAFDDLSKEWNEMHAIAVDYWMPLPEAPKMKGGAE